MSVTHRSIQTPSDSKTSEKGGVAVKEVAVHDSEDQKPVRHPSLQNIVDKYWLVEFGAWLLSATGLIGTVAVLCVTREKRMPDWSVQSPVGHSARLEVTLNSVLSIFSTLVDLFLLVPVAASLAQLKWLWFRSGNNLSDIELFDAAAEPMGALALIWAMRGRRLACLGALIVVVAVALDFSFQQLVTFPVSPFQMATAKMPRADFLNLTSPLAEFGVQQGGSHRAAMVDSNMLAAANNGIFSDGRHGEFTVEPECKTGNCTWSEPYISLGICSQCYNITDQIKLECTDGIYEYNAIQNGKPKLNFTAPNCSYSLLDALSVSGSVYSTIGGANNTLLQISNQYLNSTHFLSDSNYLTTITLLNATFTPDTQEDTNGTRTVIKPSHAFGAECALSYCVKKFKGSVSSGLLTEEIIETFTNMSVRPGWEPLQPPSSFFPAGYNMSRFFEVDSFTHFDLASLMSDLWNGNGEISSSGVRADTNVVRRIMPMSFAQFSNMINNVAVSLTNTIRTTDHTASPLTPAYGSSDEYLPKVHVRWGWITIPSVLIGLSLILLVATAVESRKHKAILYKRSTLPAFFDILTEDGDSTVPATEVSDPKNIQQAAKKTRVRWLLTETGYRLAQMEE